MWIKLVNYYEDPRSTFSFLFFFFYFPYTVNSKTLVGFRGMFLPGKVFRRPRSLKITDQTLYSICTSWCGSKRGCSLLFHRLLMCVGHIRIVLQDPVMPTCLVLTTCLRSVKMGWHQRPKYIALFPSAITKRCTARLLLTLLVLMCVTETKLSAGLPWLGEGGSRGSVVDVGALQRDGRTGVRLSVGREFLIF